MNGVPTPAVPTAVDDRIVALDVLRGVALLGILVMNVQAFSMPFAAYTNPAAYGVLTGIDGFVWVVSHIGADQKFMAIFSMLYGAGVVLFAKRAEAKSGSATAAYYRRTVVLLLVGLAHGYLLFHGDILVAYAVCGLWVVLMRNRRPRTLVAVAAILLMVPTAISLAFGLFVPHFPPEVTTEMAAGWKPPADVVTANLEGMRGSVLEQLRTRAPMTATLETIVFLAFLVWRVSAMMLLGMALFKTGFLSGSWDAGRYRRVAVAALVVGLGLSAWGVVQNFAHDFGFAYSMFIGGIPNYWGSIAVALGYVALVMLALKSARWPRLRASLAATGRMAFTHYIAQSVVCVIIFNGLGLIGNVTRWQQVLIIVPIWAAHLWVSPRWLARYRFGPLEWAWRAATYLRLPDFRCADARLAPLVDE